MHQGERRALTRDRLVDSARRVFAERGYEDAKIDEIAGAAGLSKGAFYFHFSAKEDILVELVRLWVAERTEILKRARDGEQQPGERLAAMLAGLFEHAAGDTWPRLVLEFWSQATKLVDVRRRLQRAYRHWSQLLASAVGDAFAENDLATAEEAASAILTARDGLVAERALALSGRRSPTPSRATALALAVLSAMERSGARARLEGIEALNAAGMAVESEMQRTGAAPDAPALERVKGRSTA